MRKNKYIPLIALPITFGSLAVFACSAASSNLSWGIDANDYLTNEQEWNLSYIDDSENASLVSELDYQKNQSKSNSIYQMLVYSFADGNSDGIGDLIGAEERLTYIDQLGFGSIWLSPIHISPSYHSYDVMDYTSVSEEFGGMEAFDSFLTTAHSLGIEVYLDLVFNHTSAKHPWFQMALDPSSETYNDYYQIETANANQNSGAVDDSNNIDYYAQFWSGMPDLNLSNENVLDELKAVIEFWTKKGVDGFRFDAFRHFFDPGEELPQSVELGLEEQYILSELKSVATNVEESINRQKEIFFLGEGLGLGNGSASSQYLKYNDSPALNSVYDQFWEGRQTTNMSSIIAQNINDNLEAIKNVGETDGYDTVWSPYLDNHDTGRWINTFRRSQGRFPADQLVDEDLTNMQSALMMLSFMPGRPIVYQGDELGYHSTTPDPRIREPLLWSQGNGDINFQQYAPYGNLDFTNLQDQVYVNDSIDVGKANVLLETDNSLASNLAMFQQIRSSNKWIGTAESGSVQSLDQSPFLNLEISGAAFDGGSVSNLQNNQAILWIGSNVYSRSLTDDFERVDQYNLSDYGLEQSPSLIYSGENSSLDSESGLISIGQNGFVVVGFNLN